MPYTTVINEVLTHYTENRWDDLASQYGFARNDTFARDAFRHALSSAITVWLTEDYNAVMAGGDSRERTYLQIGRPELRREARMDMLNSRFGGRIAQWFLDERKAVPPPTR